MIDIKKPLWAVIDIYGNVKGNNTYFGFSVIISNWNKKEVWNFNFVVLLNYSFEINS